VVVRMTHERSVPTPHSTCRQVDELRPPGARGRQLRSPSDDALSPVRSATSVLARLPQVIDRTALILDIFAQQGATMEGKLQGSSPSSLSPPQPRRAWIIWSVLARASARGPGPDAARVRPPHDPPSHSRRSPPNGELVRVRVHPPPSRAAQAAVVPWSPRCYTNAARRRDSISDGIGAHRRRPALVLSSLRPARPRALPRSRHLTYTGLQSALPPTGSRLQGALESSKRPTCSPRCHAVIPRLEEQMERSSACSATGTWAVVPTVVALNKVDRPRAGGRPRRSGGASTRCRFRRARGRDGRRWSLHRAALRPAWNASPCGFPTGRHGHRLATTWPCAVALRRRGRILPRSISPAPPGHA